MPFGCQSAAPGETSSKWKRSSCGPSRRWSRRLASSRRSRYACEVLWTVEGRAVDAGELLVALVAAPVRAGEAGQLERLDRLRVLQVRAAAEVGELALRVQRDRPVGRFDELDLVGLALLLEPPSGLVAVDLLAASSSGPRRARAASRPRCARGPPRGSARGTRSRSRSRRRSVARWRSSRPGRAAAPPLRAGARSSGAAPPARRDRPCPASSGSGSPRRPRAAAAGPGRRRSSARVPPARRASARSRARRRAPWRRRAARAASRLAGRPSRARRVVGTRSAAPTQGARETGSASCVPEHRPAAYRAALAHGHRRRG